ncbi:serine palmitoyltransferase small subunit A [Ctenopharyngodon idella]|nr:serine palmitoyltransferase small subunit A [Ctenopharyngodon idella]
MCVWRLLFCYSVNIFFPAHDFNFVTIWTGRERWDQYEPSENMALGDAWKQLSWFYYQYLLVTALYMLEPWERTIFNSLLITVAAMAVYTGYVFMPQHIMAILHYFEVVQ